MIKFLIIYFIIGCLWASFCHWQSYTLGMLSNNSPIEKHLLSFGTNTVLWPLSVGAGIYYWIVGESILQPEDFE